MSARTFQDKKGRWILEDSAGELWMMYESAKATGPLEPPAKPSSLVVGAADKPVTDVR